MAGFLGIVLREGLHLTAMTLGTLLGIESHGAMTRRRKFSVRLELKHMVKFAGDLQAKESLASILFKDNLTGEVLTAT